MPGSLVDGPGEALRSFILILTSLRVNFKFLHFYPKFVSLNVHDEYLSS